MKTVFIGDIVGEPGRQIVKELLPQLVKDEGIAFVIANAENAAGGSGITPSIAEELFSYGIDVITTGDHIWKRKEIISFIEKNNALLRPLNYPENTPGGGSIVIEVSEKVKIGVINLLGRVFMQPLGCPFKTSYDEIANIRNYTQNIFVDMHAEATSEKIALGWYLDGLVTCIVGTHTHVQTADEKILPEGTAYITDVGMTGPFDSVIGRKKEEVLTRFITQMPVRFQVGDRDIRMDFVIIDFDEKTGKARSIKRKEYGF